MESMNQKLIDCILSLDRKVRAWEVAKAYWGEDNLTKRSTSNMACILLGLVEKNILVCSPEPCESKKLEDRYVFWVKGSGIEL